MTQRHSGSHEGQRTAWAWAVTAVFTALAVWAHRSGPLPLDAWGLHAAQALPAPVLRWCAVVGSVIVLATLTALAAWALRNRVRPLAFLGLMVGVPVLEELLKRFVGRPRPTGEGLGFPSGHAMASMALALFVVEASWPRLSPSARAGVTAIAAWFVAAVAVGRVGLAQHWPTDIVGGWLAVAGYAGWTLPLLRQPTRHSDPSMEGRDELRDMAESLQE